MALAVAVAAGVPGAARAAEVDNRYVRALAAVDRFLTAWTERNGAAGLAHVTSRAKQRYSTQRIRAWLVGTSSPSNAAFEVLGGRALSPTRYRFSIKLYYVLTGGGMDAPTVQTIDVFSGDDTTWNVDSIPLGP